MTEASTRHRRDRRGLDPWAVLRLGLSAALFLSAGCISLPWSAKKPVDPPRGAVDNLVLREGGLERDKSVDGEIQAKLDGGKRLYQDKEYAKAQAIFHKISHLGESSFLNIHFSSDSWDVEKKKIKTKDIALPVLDDALYYEAMCQYYQSNYREAEGTLRKYAKEFRNGAHADEVNRRLFDIANYWLDDTRKLMQAYEEKREGKRYFVMPVSYVHWTRDKPLLDTEGHAVEALEDVRLNDIGGPLGEKALFYIATLKFFREDYKDADYYYSQLYEHYPNSPLAPKAIKQAIIAKQLSTGGSCYDCRAVEESRKLIDIATRAYPKMATKDADWITRQLVSVNLQQADRDFNIAEFYRRTGHPGSAYFYYELVIRRYPNTDYAAKATARKNEVREKAAREQVATAQASDSSKPPGMLQRIFSPSTSAGATLAPPAPPPASPAPPQSLPQGLLKN